MRLNKSQEKAANTLEGDLLIIASAGTGKTTTIIERYVNLIKNIGIQPNEIMMTTFTNKAAKDMISKIKKRTKSISPFIGTMHSIFLKILREHKDLIFEGYDFTLLTDNQDKTQIIREILKQESIDSERNAVNYFSGWIGKYKSRAIFSKDLSISSGIDELRESGQISEMLDDELITYNKIWRTKVNLVYKKYQEYLDKNKLLDFDEILMKTFSLFNDYPEIRERYKNNFKSIMVDEAQDLNLIQKLILDLISSENLCLIGDDCQNIYEWRGSSNEMIFDFNEMKNQVFLEENYRSSERIIDAINNSISEMKSKIDKKLICTKDKGEDISVNEYSNSIEEIKMVATQIEDEIQNGTNPEDIAVLSRTNNIAQDFERELIKRKIPCHLSKGAGFFSREEVKDVISFIRFKANKSSYYDFQRISKIIPGLGKVSLEKIKNYSAKEKIEFSKVFDYLDNIKISETNKTSINHLIDYLKEEDINILLIKIKYYDFLKTRYANEPRKLEEKYKNLEILILMVKNASSMLEFLDSLQEIDKKDSVRGKVILSTIHGSKGLEWKTVFIVSCNEGTLPFYKDELSPVKKDSELRLFYVAISRAKEKLNISHYNLSKFNCQILEPSQFIDLIY